MGSTSIPLASANLALLRAAQTADVELLEMALSAGANVHGMQERDNFDPAPLGIMALSAVLASSRLQEDTSNHQGIVERLLDLGVPLDQRLFPSKDSYPLHTAVANGRASLVHLLLKRGAPLFTTGAEGASLVKWAASTGMNWLVRQILDALSTLGSSPDDSMRQGLERALCAAAQRGDVEQVRELLDFGVSVEARDSLFDNSVGNTALMVAASKGHKEVVDLLRERGAEIHAQGDRGMTVLIGAVRGGLTELASELLEAGADANASDFYQRTALHSATRPQQEANAHALLKHGANLLARDSGNHTPLHSAAFHGDLVIAQACLQAGEVVDVQDDWGYTPLMQAAQNGQLEMARFLFEQGADLQHVAHYQSETPLHYAIYGQHVEMAQWLVERGASLTQEMEDMQFGSVTPLMLAAALGQVSMIEMLLKAGASLDAAESEDGYTALHYVASYGQGESALECCDLLLRYGAEVNLRTGEAGTALIGAAGHGHLGVLNLLMDNGAEVDAADQWGYTALHRASQQGWHLVVQALLERGANAVALTAKGQSSLDIALAQGHLRVVNVLSR